MGTIHAFASAYSAASGYANSVQQGSTADAYLHATSTSHIGIYKFGRTADVSTGTTLGASGNMSLYQAAGITLPSSVTAAGAVTWTSAILYVNARDTLVNRGTYQVAISTNYASVGTNWSNSNILCSGSVTFSSYGSSGSKNCSITHILNGASTPVGQLKNFYVQLRNTGLSSQLRFNRVSNYDTRIAATGTILTLTASPTTTDNWGTSQTITPGVQTSNFGLSTSFRRKIDSGSYTTTTYTQGGTAPTFNTGTQSFGAHTAYVQPIYIAGCSDSTGARTYGTEASVTFYIYGNQPIGSLSVGTRTTTSIAINYTTTQYNTTTSAVKVVCYTNSSYTTVKETKTIAAANYASGSVTFTGLTINTTYYFRLLYSGTSTPASGHSKSLTDSVLASTSATTLNNTAPVAPTINWPATADKYTYNTRPWFKATTTDPDGNNIQYAFSVYDLTDGKWFNGAYDSGFLTAVASGTAQERQHGGDLTRGHHYRLYAYVKDTVGADSQSTRDFYVAAAPSTVSASTLIDDSHMSNLKTYIDTMSQYYGTGTSTTITAPTANTTAQNANWTNYATKLNAMPKHGTDIAVPGVGTIIDDAYYNSYITKLTSG